jgi:hypothetical protein
LRGLEEFGNYSTDLLEFVVDLLSELLLRRMWMDAQCMAEGNKNKGKGQCKYRQKG